MLIAGAVSVREQRQLARLAHVVIDSDAVQSQWANRVAISALQCRRYEKDVFLNLNDVPTRNDYMDKWRQSWSKMHDGMEHLKASCSLPEEKHGVEEWLAAARRYRQHFREVVDSIGEGKIVGSECANRAIAPFKDDVRTIITDTASFVDTKAATASRSGERLVQSVFLNVIATSLLAIIPIAVIIAWTIWLTREIVARNGRLVALCRELDTRHQSLDAANRELAAEIERADHMASEAQKSAQIKSEFLANVSHELRTPLHGILSYARFGESAVAEGDYDEMGEFFQNVSQSARNAPATRQRLARPVET